VDDVGRLRAALEAVEQEAKTLPWANDRRWSVATHLWTEHDAPTIDLHDLNVKLAVAAVEAIVDVAPSCASGGLVLVTGRGTHSLGGRSDLHDAVASALDRHCRSNGWQWRAGRAGRLVLVTDEARAPAILTGTLPWPLVAGALVFLGLALWYATPAGIVLTGLALLAWWVSRQPAIDTRP
jgi:hypothetical protein